MERKGFFRLSGPKGSYCWKLSVLSIALSVVGCGEPQHEYVGDPGPFASCYYQNLTNVSLPQGPTVLDAGQIWTYARRLDDVWLAVLDVVSQYQGILALDSHGTERSMLIMRAREDQRAPENQVRLATFGGFYEQWLAITVIQATESDATRVAVAVFQPDSGRLTNNEQAALRIFRQIQIQLVSPTLWTEKFVGPELEQYAVRAHAEPEPRSGKKRSYRYDELGSLLGNWVSKRLQVELVCVCCPEVTARLDDAIRCLAIAAGEPDLSVHVVIIASENVNAFALPNGDIYVSSGLLDSLDSLDEVAAVLAHELDHLIHHDATEHLRTKHGAAAGSQLVQTSAFVGGTILGILLQSPSMGSSVFTFTSTEDFLADPANIGNGVMPAPIDGVAVSTSTSFTGVYSTDQSMFYKVQKGSGASPYKPGIGTTTFASGGFSVNVNLQLDA